MKTAARVMSRTREGACSGVFGVRSWSAAEKAVIDDDRCPRSRPRFGCIGQV